MIVRLNFKEINIIYGAILTSLLITEMVSGQLISLYTVRFVQIFIILNILRGRLNFFLNFIWFIVPAAIFVLFGAAYLNLEIIVGDLFNLVWWTAFMLLLNNSLRDTQDFNKYKKYLIYSTFFLTSLFAVVGLIKLYFITQGVVWESMLVKPPNEMVRPILGSALNKDYNVYSIGVFCGVVAGMYCYKNTNRIKWKIIYALLILLSLLSGMTSLSRRGLVIGIFLSVVVTIWSFRSDTRGTLRFTRPLLRFPWIAAFLGGIILAVLTKLDWENFLSSAEGISVLQARLESIMEINSSENNTRGSRWVFAGELFNSAPFYAKILGGGFDYLESFGSYFGETEVDHPHNVWVSSLLYGGILGFICTCALTIKVLITYFKGRKQFEAIAYWYGLFLLLYFTSSNTIFSSRVFVVLLLIPFLNCFQTEKKIFDSGKIKEF